LRKSAGSRSDARRPRSRLTGAGCPRSVEWPASACCIIMHGPAGPEQAHAVEGAPGGCHWQRQRRPGPGRDSMMMIMGPQLEKETPPANGAGAWPAGDCHADSESPAWASGRFRLARCCLNRPTAKPRCSLIGRVSPAGSGRDSIRAGFNASSGAALFVGILGAATVRVRLHVDLEDAHIRRHTRSLLCRREERALVNSKLNCLEPDCLVRP
jgi:hypothetical protein